MKTILILFAALAALVSVAEAMPRPRKEAAVQQLQTEAARRDAAIAAALNRVADATANANRAAGQEATKAERGVGVTWELRADEQGRIAHILVTQSLGSNSNLGGLGGATIVLNEERRAEFNDQVASLPVGATITIGAISSSNLSDPATANAPLVAATEANRVARIEAAGTDLREVLATSYTGQALLVDAQGRKSLAEIEARANGRAKVWATILGGTKELVEVAIQGIPLVRGIDAAEQIATTLTGTRLGPDGQPVRGPDGQPVVVTGEIHSVTTPATTLAP